MEAYLISVIGGLFGLLVLVLGWIGSRVHQRLDALTVMLDTRLTALTGTMYEIRDDLKSELSEHHARISIVENQCTMHRRKDDLP